MHIHTQPTNVRRSAGAAARALWLVRWLLVLLLIWDQAGVPLHHHQHDFGIDGQWVGASLHPGHGAHADPGHDDPRISHAVLAVRPQFDVGAATVGADSGDSGLPSAAISVLALDRVAFQTAIFDLSEPRQTHRSLPPASRAPPLHT